MTKTVTLAHLLYHLYDASLYTDTKITGLTVDSRQVKPGNLFFACKGIHQDGKTFIDEAIQKGAHAILEEVDSDGVRFRTQNDIPIFPIRNLAQEIGPIAAQFYDVPSKKLKMVGVTGTNGKTSCSHFIAEALQKNEIPCGLIGTLGIGMYGNLKESGFTTPDAITLQKSLAEFVHHGAQAVSMEVSSHSIDQGRINGIDFEVGIFTNLTRDHLDYHGTMEHYGLTKKKLFENNLTKYAVINADDEFGKQLIQTLHRENIFAYSVNPTTTSSSKIPVIYADQIQLNSTGIQADVITPWGGGQLCIPLLGQFNLSNSLAVLTSLCLLELPLKKVLHTMSHLSPVPGRMQTLGGKNKPLVIVDYAHTPDALEKALIALRQHCQGKLYCLFGCGGDRDPGKRPLMAKIAEQHSDTVIVTDDNPRSEDPEKIIEDIKKGFEQPNKVIIQHDRSKAIQYIIQYAAIGDCVLIAGKGAETYQLIGQDKIPFSDVEKVMENLN